MNPLTRFPTVAAVTLAATLLTACGTYYQVTDLQSGNKYYTKDVDHEESAVRFKDARSDSVVTIQNSQVRHISKDRYNEGLTER
jgi:uncharacterized protein YdeI (BOF family)